MKILFFYAIFILSFASFSQDVVVVKEFGENKDLKRKTLLLEVGSIDGYVYGETANVFIDYGKRNKPNPTQMAQIELVKLLPKYSYWQIVSGELNLEDLNDEYFKRFKTLSLLRTNRAINGRPLDIKNRIHLIDKDSEKFEMSTKSIPEDFVVENNFDAELTPMFNQEEILRADVEVHQKEKMIKKSGTSYSSIHDDELVEMYAPKIKSVNKDKVKMNVLEDVNDSLSKNYAKTNEKSKNGLDKFYQNSVRDRNEKDIPQNISSESVYDHYKEKELAESFVSRRALNKMKRDGERWSEDMDDKVLRNYVIQNGIEAEYKRRERALNELDGHELWLKFFGGINHQSTELDNNYQRLNYSLGFGYNLHFSRLNSSYTNWSMDFYGESSVSYLAINDDSNASSKEILGGVNLNYYYLNNPISLNRFIGHVGIGMKIGQSEAVYTEGDSIFSYQIVGLPILSTGLKYRFRAGDYSIENPNFGAALAFGASYEMMNYSSADSIIDNEVYGKIATQNFKYFFGVHFYY